MRFLGAGNFRIKVHHWSMSNDFKLIVYFSCPCCATIYTRASKSSRSDTPATFIAEYALLRSMNGAGSITSLIGN